MNILTNKYLLNSYYNFPLMRTDDFIKQIYQAEYGVEHLLGANIENRIKDECQHFATVRSGSYQLFDSISSELVRVNLRPYLERGYSFGTLAEMMRKVQRQGNEQSLEARLQQFVDMISYDKIDLPISIVKKAINGYRDNGYGPVRHSTSYRLNYNPHYRVISKQHAVLLPLIARIDNLLNSKLNCIIAIDGMCGSGKSYYSQALAEYYNFCNIIKCDDFFLPRELANQQRLAIAGNNIHHERLKEVLSNVTKDAPFVYQKYDCSTATYVDAQYNPKRLTIVEGSYSLNSNLSQYYDLGAILTISNTEQRFRLQQRERERYPMFENRWIPLENKHLSTLDFSRYVVIDTTDIDYISEI